MSIPRLPFIGITIAALALAIAAGAFALAGALGAGPATAEGDGDGDKGAALAEALGVTVEELEAAKRRVALDRIAAAVESGRLGEERAGTLREAIESGEERGHWRGHGGHGGHGWGWHGDGDDGGAAFAEALGVTVEELDAAMRQVALDKIDAAVADGKLTEERAEALREAIESGEERWHGRFERGHRGRGFGKGAFGHDADGFRGMTAEERQQAMFDRLDAAVEAGMLSAEQAGALRTLIESADGDGWRGFGFGGRGFHRGHR